MQFMKSVAAAAAVAILLAASSAYAQPTATDTAAYRTEATANGYRVNFDDDPLEADGLGPIGARIAVMARASRATLIRPRTAFVAELLKSVEHL
jgi:hypothetical protein